ncbi:YHS domain-containing (seleno)protein [Sneathiella aquimaris]|uniref:YHS domain-containing (seleno)protein n=1 Tax=Sneathiella aquimaris TaxID=2599305 RepID=UPI00146CD3E1|nr:YHS domain-containing (seleno)protein [Sneathiella aquimaris]
MFTKALLKYSALFFLIFYAGSLSAGEEQPYRTTVFGWAAEGYDVVAYFTESRPVEGLSAFKHKWQGVNWRFSSAANRDLFAKDPSQYAPQFGGYCAYAVSQGYTASVIPEAWSIVEGKLYLNYSKGVQEIWEKDIPGYISAGTENWPKIKKDL